MNRLLLLLITTGALPRTRSLMSALRALISVESYQLSKPAAPCTNLFYSSAVIKAASYACLRFWIMRVGRGCG